MPDSAAVRRLLAADRDATLQRIDTLRAEIRDVVEASTDVAVDDEHDPEGATIAFERERVRALLDQALDHVADVDAAIARLDAGSYGTCERCGQTIGAPRLEARPVARTCIACAGQASSRWTVSGENAGRQTAM